jgi:thiamine-phosphate diphosphorylase/hydroxyethylthiazole kinase
LSRSAPDVKTVCIGGINAKNCQRVLYQTAAADKKLDGIAVVSAIMAAKDPKKAASDLCELVATPPPFATNPSTMPLTHEHIIRKIPELVKRLAGKKPLCHNMTNLVVQNFAANVALAV